MDSKEINHQVYQEIKAVAEQQGIALQENEPQRILSWKIGRLKKVWSVGTKKDTGQKVIIKLRPLGSVTSVEEFRRTETVEAQITDHLVQLGLRAQRTLKTQFDEAPEWIIREFSDGKPIGDIMILPTIDIDELFNFLVEMRQDLDTITDKIDHRLLNRHDWQKKWLEEFNQRRQAVITHLGHEVASTLASAIKWPAHLECQPSVLHNDLAPQNILQNEQGFFLIDWGEACLGPRAIDWAMVWSFALDSPELREKILAQAQSEAKTEKELQEVKEIFLALNARMVASFAEWHDYYKNHPDVETRFARVVDEAIAALPKAWKNFQELQENLA